MSYALFWAILQRLIFISFKLIRLWRWNRQSVTKRRHIKIQTPGNYPEESIQHSEHGGSLKSRYLHLIRKLETTSLTLSTLN